MANEEHLGIVGKGIERWNKWREANDHVMPNLYSANLRDANLSGANQMEITNARAREEHQKRQMLFPITTAPFAHIQEWRLFDADRQTDSASEIREYFIPDFSNWMDHDSYQRLSTGCCAI